MTNAEATDKAVTVAEQGAHDAPEKASSKKGTRQKGAPKGGKTAKGAKIEAAAPKKGTGRQESRQARPRRDYERPP